MSMAQLTEMLRNPKGTAAPGSSPAAPATDSQTAPEPEQREAVEGEEAAAPVLSDSPENPSTPGTVPETPETEAPGEEAPPEPDLETGDAAETSQLHDEVARAIAEAKLPKGAVKMVKRINALVDQRDTERNRRLDAEARLAELQSRPAPSMDAPAVAAGSSFDPVANHPDMIAVNRNLARVEETLNWAEANPDGAEVDDGKGGKQFVDAAYVARVLKTLNGQRTELLAQRGSLTVGLNQSVSEIARQNHDKALKLYPWHADRESAEHQAAAKILQKYPAIKQSPDYLLILGRLVEGQKLEAAKLKPAAAPAALPVRPAKAPTTPTPQPGAPARAAARENGPEAEVKAAQEEFDRTGSEKSLINLRIAKRAARARLAA